MYYVNKYKKLKKTMKMKNLLFLVGLMVCLFSCGSESQSTKTIEENTTSAIVQDTIINGVSISYNTITGSWMLNEIGDDSVYVHPINHLDTTSHEEWEIFWVENASHLEIVGVDYNIISDMVFYREKKRNLSE
jgi:hypothetical protein